MQNIGGEEDGSTTDTEQASIKDTEDEQRWKEAQTDIDMGSSIASSGVWLRTVFNTARNRWSGSRWRWSGYRDWSGWTGADTARSASGVSKVSSSSPASRRVTFDATVPSTNTAGLTDASGKLGLNSAYDPLGRGLPVGVRRRSRYGHGKGDVKDNDKDNDKGNGNGRGGTQPLSWKATAAGAVLGTALGLLAVGTYITAMSDAPSSVASLKGA